jgi:succinate dehydrogenase / fumarate reductase cytochrome b subunit
MSGLHESSIGKKVLMAASGTLLFGFVIGHLLGNLKIFTGELHFNEYAVFLRTAGTPALPEGGLLWLARIGLLAAVSVHLISAFTLWRRSRAARTQGYVKRHDLSFSYASRTMRWGGVIILLFVVYHLLHLTWGVAHSDFVCADHPDAFHGHANAFHNVVSGFQIWWVSAVYVLAMIPLGMHIYHGLWSATQTLAVNNDIVRRIRRPLAGAIACGVVIGNISIPLSVLMGWIG